MDVAWQPDPPTGASRKARLGYFVVLLLALLPVWFRVPLIVFPALALLRMFVRRLFHTFDSRPDFVISSEGIAGWDRSTFCFIPWTQMSELKVSRREQRIWGFKILPTQEWIYIYGTETGPRRFLGAFPPRRPCIMYSQMYFPKKNTEILLAIRPYRPDLVNADPFVPNLTEIPRA